MIMTFFHLSAYSDNLRGEIVPFYNYQLFINKAPFSLSVSLKYLVEGTGDYSFYINRGEYLNFDPVLVVREFNAFAGTSRALITKQDIMGDRIEWRILDVPQESELSVNYRIVPSSSFDITTPLKSFFNGSYGLLFFDTCLIKPVFFRDDSVQIRLDSSDIAFHSPFSIAMTEKDIYFSSSLKNISQMIIPLGDWHKIEIIGTQSIINLYLAPSIDQRALSRIYTGINTSLGSGLFNGIIDKISNDMGIIGQFIICFYSPAGLFEDDIPVLQYNGYTFIFISLLGEYEKDLQVLISREILRQTAKLYIAGLTRKKLTEYAPINALLTFVSILLLEKNGIVNNEYIDRFTELVFLRYRHDLKSNEYLIIGREELSPDIFFMPGILDNKANMFYKMFHAMSKMDIEIDWIDFMIKFMKEYQRGISEEICIISIIKTILPEYENKILKIYQIIENIENEKDITNLKNGGPLWIK